MELSVRVGILIRRKLLILDRRMLSFTCTMKRRSEHVSVCYYLQYNVTADMICLLAVEDTTDQDNDFLCKC